MGDWKQAACLRKSGWVLSLNLFIQNSDSMSSTQNCHPLCKACNPSFDIQLKLKFSEEKKESIYSTQSVAMSLYSWILILHIGYITLSLIQLEHFCYLCSLPDDHNLAQKSEARFIGWMITFIKSDQLLQICEGSVFHIPDR